MISPRELKIDAKFFFLIGYCVWVDNSGAPRDSGGLRSHLALSLSHILSSSHSCSLSFSLTLSLSRSHTFSFSFTHSLNHSLIHALISFCLFDIHSLTLPLDTSANSLERLVSPWHGMKVFSNGLIWNQNIRIMFCITFQNVTPSSTIPQPFYFTRENINMRSISLRSCRTWLQRRREKVDSHAKTTLDALCFVLRRTKWGEACLFGGACTPA